VTEHVTNTRGEWGRVSAGRFVCAFAWFGGLKPQMPVLPPRLRLVVSESETAAGCCSTPACRLPACAASGLCGPCARVYAGVFVLLQRLLMRDLARLEATAPGLTAAAHRSLNRPDARAMVPSVGAAGHASGRLVWPEPGELAALEALLSELRSTGVVR
jgi:hypothetical protein